MREKEKEWEREKEEGKRSCSLSKSKKGAESDRTEPASASTSKKVAKPKPDVPASVSGDSRTSSKGPGSGHAEPERKLAKETMDYLLMLHGELFPCPQKRKLQEKIILLGKSFNLSFSLNEPERQCGLRTECSGRRRWVIHAGRCVSVSID